MKKIICFILTLIISLSYAGETDSTQWNKINGYCTLACGALGGAIGGLGGIAPMVGGAGLGLGVGSAICPIITDNIVEKDKNIQKAMTCTNK